MRIAPDAHTLERALALLDEVPGRRGRGEAGAVRVGAAAGGQGSSGAPGRGMR